jgi:restriction system protein
VPSPPLAQSTRRRRLVVGECAVMTVLMAAVIGGLLGHALGRASAAYRPQNASEARVRDTLRRHFPSADYHLLNHVTLPTASGTTQIDHLLISRSGVFVIETKHYTGWIFAHPHWPTWTQVLYRAKFRFQNPLHQNQGHVAAVRALLDFLPPEDIHPVVVFTGGAEFKTDVPSGVYDLEGLVGFVQAMRRERLSVNRMQFCVGRLETQRLALTQQTDVEHVAYVQRASRRWVAGQRRT